MLNSGSEKDEKQNLPPCLNSCKIERKNRRNRDKIDMEIPNTCIYDGLLY
jgi:hypothetical protein